MAVLWCSLLTFHVSTWSGKLLPPSTMQWLKPATTPLHYVLSSTVQSCNNVLLLCRIQVDFNASEIPPFAMIYLKTLLKTGTVLKLCKSSRSTMNSLVPHAHCSDTINYAISQAFFSAASWYFRNTICPWGQQSTTIDVCLICCICKNKPQGWCFLKGNMIMTIQYVTKIVFHSKSNLWPCPCNSQQRLL